ncbi:hypothetical protein WOLCODRAFT_22064 [Wolfiporia cocos MD-104 SS10]|uniref:Uncharacterized protein n=1 Tax=Wolfiporia cocos (strain MD-104) TaxID=742152 RepID=A0A2H3J7A3_WOLCO|nr:hypothetical protein WOLCODRAFT_22064 [Wolfiporia cocos MD-104 SS10]
MSSTGLCHRRHRSHSASSPIRGTTHLSDDPKWRMSVKRARPSYPRSPSSYNDILGASEPPEKWDVDHWRRGKRARRDSATQGGEGSALSSGSVFSGERPPSLRPMPPLACTPAAFGLLPDRRRQKTRRLSRGAETRPDLAHVHDEELMSATELERMRADALCELQRSIEESGEGLVLRMRDYESARSASPTRGAAHYRRRRREADEGRSAEDAGDRAADDDDEVEIVSADCLSRSAPFHFRAPSHQKRSLSLAHMDVDLPEVPPALDPGHADGSELTDGSGHCSSTYSSDDDDDLSPDDAASVTPQGVAFTPALTHTYTSSANSSLISLPLSQPHGSSPPSSLPDGLGTSPNMPSSASRSEKALAALTLAMANGAADLNDYSAVHFADAVEEHSAFNEYHVGELWK